MQFDNDKIKSTLKETSKDDTGNYVVDFSQEVFNFDIITEEVAQIYRISQPQRSCDALYIKDDNNVFLIEFKNVRASRMPKKHLKLKAYDSIMTLQIAFFSEYSLNDIKEKVNLVVVYNDEGIVQKEQSSTAFDSFKEKMYSFAGNNEEILFGLDIYKNVLYKDILTIEKQKFVNETFNMIFG